ncbi:hypothetical protein JW859_09260 [bacterium]|nr:hypothetical protein [bacterium]
MIALIFFIRWALDTDRDWAQIGLAWFAGLFMAGWLVLLSLLSIAPQPLSVGQPNPADRRSARAAADDTGLRVHNPDLGGVLCAAIPGALADLPAAAGCPEPAAVTTA